MATISGNDLQEAGDEALGTTKTDTGAIKIKVNGCTMLPLRFLAEAFGAVVNWDEKEKLIEVRL